MPRRQRREGSIKTVKLANGSARYYASIGGGQAGLKTSLGGFDDRPSAELAIKHALRQRDGKERANKPRTTFARAIAFVKLEMRDTTPGNQQWFEQHIAKLVTYFGAQTLVSQITQARVQSFINRMKEKKKEDGKPYYSHSTIDHYRRCLSRILNLARDKGWMSKNPASKVKGLRVVKKKHDTFTKDELSKAIGFLRDSGQEEKADLMSFLFYTGLRRAELARIKMEDINLSAKTIAVVGKTESEPVDLSQACCEILKRMMKRSDSAHLVDASENSEKSRVGKIARLMREAASSIRDAKVIDMKSRSLTAHALRHSFVQSLTDAGHPIQLVSRMARHSRIEQTMRYYEKPKDKVEEALGALDL